jgi:transcription factor CP2-like protein
MSTRTNNPAPHAGEKEAPAIPKAGQTPGMGAPPNDGHPDSHPTAQSPRGAGADREPGTRPDGEAMPPAVIDPAPDGKGEGIPPLPEPNVEGVGKESGPSADKHDDRRNPRT